MALKVTVNSFSFKKGLPIDHTENGGGFVFDCRGILNPGRKEEFKKLTGRDEAVQDFLITETTFPEFMELAIQLVSINIKNYIERDFDNLMISFGCTGGQHRSVFAADRMKDLVEKKFECEVVVHHLIQDAKNWKND